MKLVEAGTVDLDAPAHVYADPVLQAIGGVTMKGLWDGDAQIESVTTRQVTTLPAQMGCIQ